MSSSHSSASVRIMGVDLPLKLISLVTLTVQNSALTILLHYSRTSTPPDQTYSAPAAVLLNELLKGSISFAIALKHNFEAGPLVEAPGSGGARVAVGHYSPVAGDAASSSRGKTGQAYFAFVGAPEGQGWESKVKNFVREVVPRCRILQREIFSSDCWKLSVPAILYVIQNNLQFVAASNLDPATFQVSYQMKIMTTALFSVLMLNKRLTSSKWASLFALAVGVGIVQLQSVSSSGGGHRAPGHEMNAFTGFAAVTAACMTSGLAGVYFEKTLKGSTTDLWIRNIQLSFFSLLPALMPALFPDFSLFSDAPVRTEPRPWLFANFGFWAWATVLTQVIGGLVTALVIKYSDNILKGFATSLSIVLSFLAGVMLFGFSITPSFVIGTSVVLAATFSYNRTVPVSSPAMSHTSGNGMMKNEDAHLDSVVIGAPGNHVHGQGAIIGDAAEVGRRVATYDGKTPDPTVGRGGTLPTFVGGGVGTPNGHRGKDGEQGYYGLGSPMVNNHSEHDAYATMYGNGNAIRDQAGLGLGSTPGTPRRLD